MLEIVLAICIYGLRYLEHPNKVSLFFTSSLQMSILSTESVTCSFDRDAKNSLAPLLFHIITLCCNTCNIRADVYGIISLSCKRVRDRCVYRHKETGTEKSRSWCIYIYKRSMQHLTQVSHIIIWREGKFSFLYVNL